MYFFYILIGILGLSIIVVYITIRAREKSRIERRKRIGYPRADLYV